MTEAWPSLSKAERDSLDQRGFVLFPGLIGAEVLERLRARVEELHALEGDKAGLEVHQQPGTRRLADLVNKGEVFDQVWNHPRLLAAVAHVLKRPFRLSSLNARDALPGQGEQAFHADWSEFKEGQPFYVVNSIWMLDDFTKENGATRVIPGSHVRTGGPPKQEDPAQAYPGQVLITGPAGSVAVYVAHLWHGGTRNLTKGTRRALHCFYCAAEMDTQTDQRKYLLPETRARLGPRALDLLLGPGA